ncbi:MAG: type II toxin-antitoxin system HipA family toxin [Gemmatimonadales bacterium]|nr:type II toxin-antitoxin system HipA family toxin [Gemmatimonadales bacterium]MDZ4390433.1 type II toxin-antitoxin system HipA family toxin [Gemmatimonadales bacterium]
MTQRWRPVIRLEVDYQDDGEPIWVGSLARDRDGAIYFRYAQSWRSRACELSPLTLPAATTVQTVRAPSRSGGTGLHGVFGDSLPGQWGLAIQDRTFRRHGIPLDLVGALDRLAHLGQRTMGALTYRPSRPSRPVRGEASSLDVLVAHADGALADSPAPETTSDDLLDALERAAGTAGGAQPKAVIAVNARGSIRTVGSGKLPSGYRHYLVKFTPLRHGLGLRRESGLIEEVYARLARSAGIVVPPTRLLTTSDGRAHFAIERFDRTAGGGRRHIHTLGGLLERGAADSTDYSEYFAVTRHLTRRHEEMAHVWRRLCFNLLACNDDDHSHNIAFLLDPAAGWTLSPAYDLTFSPGRGDQRGMTIAGHARGTTRRIALDCAQDGDLDRVSAERIYDEVRAALLTWPSVAEAAGVPAPTIVEIESAMAQRRTALEG